KKFFSFSLRVFIVFALSLVAFGFTQIPAYATANTTLAFTIGLQDIGSTGDAVNTHGNNSHPIHTTRIVKIHVYKQGSPVLISSLTAQLTFNAQSGLFTENIDAGNLPSDTYTLFISTPGFLKKEDSTITITAGQTNTIPPITLVNGDM